MFIGISDDFRYSQSELNGMDYDILKSVSLGSDGAQDAENSRIAAVADELRRLCQLHETQSGTGQAHVTPFDGRTVQPVLR